MRHLLAEERIHLRLGAVLGANLPPPFLDPLRLILELGLRPWCRHGVPGDTRSFHFSVAGSSRAVTFGSQGSTRAAGGR